MATTSLPTSSCCGPTCCGGSKATASSVTEAVRDRYAAVATSTLSSNDAGVHKVAEAFGYSKDELASIPAEANMGLSCGNPVATASLKPGETVLDLGCGGGLDVLLAAQRVGPTGRAIGVDMTPEMIARAKKNAVGIDNVEFHLSTIDKLPVPDASVDCIVSNCVINLAPDKPAVFREAFRALKPGGRLAASDLVLKKPLPAGIASDLAAYVGCIAGALPVLEYEQGLRDAGFDAIDIIDAHTDLNAYANIEGQSGCCSPAMNEPTGVHAGIGEILTKIDINEYVASAKIYAVKR